MQSSGRPLGWRAKLRKPSILPRFNLRVALVTTALVAVVTWQGGIVLRRRAAMRDSPHTFMLDRLIPGEPAASDHHPVNLLRALLGDEPVRQIYMVPGEDWKAEQVRLQGLFPEATIEGMRPPLETPVPN